MTQRIRINFAPLLRLRRPQSVRSAMTSTVVFTAGFVLCILVVIVAVARRDAPTAAAGILGALVLGVLAALSGEKDDRYDC